jgi:hypothetical protein
LVIARHIFYYLGKFIVGYIGIHIHNIKGYQF